jgi:DNA-binding transcriptional MerR regulator
VPAENEFNPEVRLQDPTSSTITIGEARGILGVSTSTLRRWEKISDFFVIERQGEKARRYYTRNIKDIAALMEEGQSAEEAIENIGSIVSESYADLIKSLCVCDGDSATVAVERMYGRQSERKLLFETILPACELVADRFDQGSHDGSPSAQSEYATRWGANLLSNLDQLSETGKYGKNVWVANATQEPPSTGWENDNPLYVHAFLLFLGRAGLNKFRLSLDTNADLGRAAIAVPPNSVVIIGRSATNERAQNFLNALDKINIRTDHIYLPDKLTGRVIEPMNILVKEPDIAAIQVDDAIEQA